VKALIALSGGVDSSVAALLMQERGYTCIGVTLQLFSDTNRDYATRSCCSLADVNDARAVSHKLNMPYYVLNFSDAFEKYVINHFVERYSRGETPNPCIECNRVIKFNRLFLTMQQLDFDYLVTGHYARIEQSGGRFLLKKARDSAKDQSYVLYMLNQKQLASMQFPLGSLSKKEVRERAAEAGFVNADKRDSQDICFVPDHDYASFIEQYTGIPSPSGSIINKEGTVLGSHKGLIRYTIGQRKGIGVSGPAPHYVCAKDCVQNTLTVGSEKELYTKILIADSVNFISCERIEKPLRVQVKTRYLQKEQEAVLEQLDSQRIRLTFDAYQRALTPGQAVVFYDSDTVIGGATISTVYA
jgi:tRNA-specific 2-thiouridylase